MKKKKKVIPKSTRIKRLKIKADKALQDYYRSQNLECWSCSAPATVAHHHCMKSSSSFLRYDPKNIIPLCCSCHFSHHQGSIEVSYRYRQRLDEDYLIANKSTYKSWSEEELQELIQRFKIR